MPKIEELLSEMNEILDLLIENAKQLLDLSQRVITEDELIPRQKEQEKLLNQLLDKDDAFHKALDSSKTSHQSPLKSKIDKKINEFQELNMKFIDNMTNTHGLIHFEEGKLKKREKA